MSYDIVVDRELQIVWVRYSGTVTMAERRAAAEAALDGPGGPPFRRFLMDYRRATTSGGGDATAEELAEYLARMLRGKGARAAWLVNYDYQLDPAVEARAREFGIAIMRFRDFDEAVAWLRQPDPVVDEAIPTWALTEEPLSGTPAARRSAQGSFEVKVAPQGADNPPAQAAALLRLSLDKRYSGPLDAVGQGEMLADGGGGRKDGAYVAMERVTGTLHGRAGSFALVHRALMRHGTPEGWSVVVVPGSGTGDLAGIEGSLRITIEHGTHFYDLDYTLPG